VIDKSEGDFADVLHMLSFYMQGIRVRESVQRVRDRRPQLLKDIAKEDQVYSSPSVG
jgi:hypothetical protein